MLIAPDAATAGAEAPSVRLVYCRECGANLGKYDAAAGAWWDNIAQRKLRVQGRARLSQSCRCGRVTHLELGA